MTSKTVGDSERSVGRRDLLKRAGQVAAVAAGTVAATSALGGTANAAPGDNLVLGQSNDAGGATTTLTGASAGPLLTLAPTGAGAPLNLGPVGPNFNEPTAGDFFATDVELFFGVDVGAPNPVGVEVFTELSATQIVPITPSRVLDTRTSSGRSLVVSGSIDSAGRVKSGSWLVLDLTSLGFFTAIVANVTATGSLSAGYLTLAPTVPADRPATSTVNYAAGQTIANCAISAVNPEDGTVAIYVYATCQVILDVTALYAPSAAFVTADMPLISTKARTRALKAHAAAAKKG